LKRSCRPSDDHERIRARNRRPGRAGQSILKALADSDLVAVGAEADEFASGFQAVTVLAGECLCCRGGIFTPVVGGQCDLSRHVDIADILDILRRSF